MKYYKAITLLILFIFSLSRLNAAERKVIPLDEAINNAKANNREIAAAKLRCLESDKRVSQSWGDLVPTIETAATATRQGAESGITSLSDGSYDLRVVQASLVLNPGVFYNTLKIASHERAYNREELRKIELQVTADTIKSYFSVIRTAELIKTRKDSKIQLKSNYEDVQNLFRNGSVPRYELLQAEIQYKNTWPLLMEAENANRSAIDMLNFVIGSDAESFDASVEKVLLPKLKPISEDEVITMLLSAAIKNRPEVIQLDIREKQSRLSADTQRSLYLWPTFFVQGNAGYTKNLPQTPSTANPALSQAISTISGTDEWQKNWQLRAGASFRWNGFLPFDKISEKEKEEKIRTEEINIYITQLKQSITYSVKRNYLLLKTAYDTIELRKATILTADEGLRIARESYREGIIKNSELLAAESSLSAARSVYIDSLYQFYISLAELTKETGSICDRIIFEEAAK